MQSDWILDVLTDLKTFAILNGLPAFAEQLDDTALVALAEISAQVEPGHHAILLLDQAWWHTSQALETPPNITLLPLPAKAPELNPVENLWQFLRDNRLSSRIFRNYADIVDYCCAAWNTIADQPWRIMSIGLRDWAQEY